MGGLFKQLDSVLRGESTRAEMLRDGRLEVSARAMTMMIILLGMFYGACMGTFNVMSGTPNAWMQIISSALKIPALFLLTLVVTFPSLYVFNALVGSRLTLVNMLRLILASIGVMLAVLAGFGTIVGFFNFTSSSYPFILLLNVIVCTVAGVLGLGFLLQTLRRLSEPLTPPPPPPPSPPPPQEPVESGVPESVAGFSTSPPPYRPQAGALTRVQPTPTTGNVKIVFRIWVVVFALVGAQMSWVLRPFVGNFDNKTGFVWFRDRGGSFFERVFEVIKTLLGGG